MKKNIVKVFPFAVMLNLWFLAIFPLLLWGLTFFLFGFSNDPVWVIILFSVALFFPSVYFIIFALYMIQRAEISEQGITIYSMFFSTIKVIRWNELFDIRTKSIITFSNAYGYNSSRDWIVLYTDPSQKEKEPRLSNRKKTGPWFITYTKETMTVLTEYVIKYAPHICDDPNIFF